MTKRIIDLSVQLEPATPVFPDYEPFDAWVLETAEDPPSKGRRSLNISRIAQGLHCGTHMDAPRHFIPGARTIEAIPLEQCAGPALLIRLPGRARSERIEPSALEPYSERIRQVRKVVLDTGWREAWGKAGYFCEHPVISGAAAKFLVGCGIHLIGVDMPSVDRPLFDAHLEFLGNNVVIVENLTNLEKIRDGVFELIAFPLKLTAREASPVRAIAMEIN